MTGWSAPIAPIWNARGSPWSRAARSWEDAHTVRLLATGETLRAKRILVAVGARPSMQPAVPGMEFAITSNEVFDLPAAPRSVLVIGGGYIAVEFAGIFAGLGIPTTLAHRGDKLLRGFDEDVRTRLGEAYAARGIDLKLSVTPLRLEKGDDGIAVSFSDGSQQTYDQVMLATGRTPNTEGLGLDKAGVVLDDVGAVVVDAYSRTLIPSIYAIGDVTNRANLTPGRDPGRACPRRYGIRRQGRVSSLTT